MMDWGAVERRMRRVSGDDSVDLLSRGMSPKKVYSDEAAASDRANGAEHTQWASSRMERRGAAVSSGEITWGNASGKATSSLGDSSGKLDGAVRSGGNTLGEAESASRTEYNWMRK